MSEKPKKSADAAIRVLPGVSIYKVDNSRFWYVRVWDRTKKKYIVKGTKETSSIAAKRLAQDLAVTLLQKKTPTEREFTFKTCPAPLKLSHYFGANGGIWDGSKAAFG